jgi:DNA-binding Lrp family transcriptional regulator
MKVAAVICVDVEQNKWDQVVEGLARQPAVRYVSKTAGSFDVLAFTRFANKADLTEFLEKVVAKMDGVRNSETFVVLDFQLGSMYADLT